MKYEISQIAYNFLLMASYFINAFVVTYIPTPFLVLLQVQNSSERLLD